MTPEEKVEKLLKALDEICQLTYTNTQGWSHTPYCEKHMKQYSQIHAVASRVSREIDTDSIG